MEVIWSEFKKFIDDRWLSIQYVTIGANYHLKAFDGYFDLDCILPIGVDNADTNDFETNYKSKGNQSYSDPDGTVYIRPKAAKKGWVYAAIPIEFATATLDSLYSKLKDASDRGGIMLKLYDAEGVEITDSANEGDCVKTVIIFEPTYDYEVLGGAVRQASMPESNVRIWVTAVPDVPAIYGGSKEFIGGLNMKLIDKLTVDGRVSKLLAYNATYHTNKMEFIMKHDAGVKHNLMIMIELFRA